MGENGPQWVKKTFSKTSFFLSQEVVQKTHNTNSHCDDDQTRQLGPKSAAIVVIR